MLGQVSLIACEDTRHTRKLLDHLGITTPATSYHEHNEASKAEELVAKLHAGSDIALVSDAGTPLISDPGYRIVAAAVAAGISVVPLPGPSAILAALAASGLPTDSFRFGGFLPPKSTQRRKILEDLRDETATLVFYEAPHRILDALEDVEAVLGPRQVAVAREMTKLHEEFLRGTAAEVRAELAQRPAVKGEMTLLIGKAKEGSMPSHQSVEDAVAQLEREGCREWMRLSRWPRRGGWGSAMCIGYSRAEGANESSSGHGNTPMSFRPSSVSTAGVPRSGSSWPGMPRQ